MGRIRQWWGQPDNFHWLSEYLGARQLQRFTRFMMGTIVAALGAVPVLMLWSPSGPHSPVGRAVAVLVAVCCAAMATMWFTRWPTHQQSATFAVLSNGCIAASCLMEVNPETALLGSMAFAALAGYVAFFHSVRYLTLTLFTAAGTALFAAWEIAAAGDVAMAAAKLLVVFVGVLAVPFSGQVLVHLLSADALNANTDPLTGLRNRRGFNRGARELIAASTGDPPPCFTVVMLDLDGFKKVNDTQGHAIGDRILIAVGDSLRRASPAGSVVARVGGEEFLVAETTPASEAQVTAERLRRAVAANPWGVTASLGVASVTLLSIDGDTTRRMVGHLVDSADAAMYEAKRAGGNRIRHSGAAVFRT
ncbi:GGDEF domain-containing protein [Mycobacterium sp. NPDC050551]|uniref:GGDEF domain-containing protein n=1 Tax=Mycobacterium sp. NPDC050551 TaxID=3155407 RepID=UPI0034303886